MSSNDDGDDKEYSGLFGKIKLTGCLLRDYFKGNYKELPWTTIAAIIFCIIYLISPIDIIPDVIPVLGLLDDVVIVSLVYRAVCDDLNTYAKWKIAKEDKENQDSDEEKEDSDNDNECEKED